MTLKTDELDYLRDVIRSKMNDIADHMSGGACKDYAEYQNHCGIVYGLELAEREILDLKQRYEEA